MKSIIIVSVSINPVPVTCDNILEDCWWQYLYNFRFPICRAHVGGIYFLDNYTIANLHCQNLRQLILVWQVDTLQDFLANKCNSCWYHTINNARSKIFCLGTLRILLGTSPCAAAWKEAFGWCSHCQPLCTGMQVIIIACKCSCVRGLKYKKYVLTFVKCEYVFVPMLDWYIDYCMISVCNINIGVKEPTPPVSKL